MPPEASEFHKQIFLETYFTSLLLKRLVDCIIYRRTLHLKRAPLLFFNQTRNDIFSLKDEISNLNRKVCILCFVHLIQCLWCNAFIFIRTNKTNHPISSNSHPSATAWNIPWSWRNLVINIFPSKCASSKGTIPAWLNIDFLCPGFEWSGAYCFCAVCLFVYCHL